MSEGKQPFFEDYSSDDQSALDRQIVDFDWAGLERAFGEVTTDEDRDAVVKCVSALFQWLTAVNMENRNAQQKVGRRFLALAWVVNPNLFQGISATKLARKIGIKAPYHFQKLTGEVSRHFGIRNRGQRHAWNLGVRKNAR
ncbi:MAG TPA: hypothetical protein VGO67_23530 [Verrucomicrobiae bacterium]|jgi:urease accessory protein UreF